MLPLYSSLPSADQMRVFEPTPAGLRKVVVATTIAETSVTLDGMAYVVDSMFVRLPVYNPVTGCAAPRALPSAACADVTRGGRAAWSRWWCSR